MGSVSRRLGGLLDWLGLARLAAAATSFRCCLHIDNKTNLPTPNDTNDAWQSRCWFRVLSSVVVVAKRGSAERHGHYLGLAGASSLLVTAAIGPDPADDASTPVVAVVVVDGNYKLTGRPRLFNERR